jgi:hypothetical protein
MENKDFIMILPLYLLFFTSLSSSLSAFGAPQGGVSPGCYPTVDEFEGRFNVNGFLPNSFVGWELVGPDGSSTMHGYFATNTTGGFEEDAELETLTVGEHSLFLYDDLTHDYIVDQNGNLAKITIEVPCN